MKICLTNIFRVATSKIPTDKLSKRAKEKFYSLEQNAPESAVQCAIGDLLLSAEQIESGNGAGEVLQNENGKPYILNAPFEFNISHSKNVVVLATNDQPVGIDVQTLSSAKLDMAKTLLNQLELEQFNSLLTDDAKAKHLIKCFTQKEAYVKMLGERLPYPPSVIKSYPNAKFVTKYIFQDNEVYCLTVCSPEITSLTFKVYDVFELIKP